MSLGLDIEWLRKQCPEDGFRGIDWYTRLKSFRFGRALRILAAAAQQDPLPTRAALHFARYRLDLPNSQIGAWHRRAWWGFHASKLCSQRLQRVGNPSDVLAELEPVDWELLDRLRAQGKGVIVLANQFGPGHVISASLAAAGRPSIRIAAFQIYQHPSVPANQPMSRETVGAKYVQALPHLRRNGIATLTIDGPNGHRRMTVEMLRYPYDVSLGGPRLARVTGAPILPVMAQWNGMRMKLSWGEPVWFNDRSTVSEAAWIQGYVSRLADLLTQNPELVTERRLFTDSAPSTQSDSDTGLERSIPSSLLIGIEQGNA